MKWYPGPSGLAFVCLGVLAVIPGCTGKKAVTAEKPFEIEKEYKRGPVSFMIRVDRKEITIADRLRLELEARAGEDYEVKLPEFGEKLEEFGIVDYQAPPATLGEANTLILRKSYVLEPFLSGDYRIPPMKVAFRKKGETEEEKHELESEELTVKVKSMLPENAAELAIKDIAPPVELPRGARAWLYWLIGTMLLGACGTAGLIIMWRRARPAETARRLAHEIAYGELEKLLAGKLVEKGETKAFYVGLSDILRRYIENRFGLRAPERTTEEFLAELRATDVLAAPHKELLKDFLRHCDMVKFAEHQPRTEEIQRTFDACRRFIAETEEKPEETEAPERPASKAASHAV